MDTTTDYLACGKAPVALLQVAVVGREPTDANALCVCAV